MWAILSVFRKEFRENLRDRRTLISALIFGPLFGPLLFGAALSLSIERGTSEADKPVTLTVSHAERAPNLLAHLRQYGVKIESVSYDDAAAREAVKQHRRPLVLMVTDDFGSRFQASQPAQLLLYIDSSDASNSKDVSRIRALLSHYGSLLARLRVMTRGVDPLAPEAPLIFCLSPLVGTPLTTSAKFAVVAKSPLTGMLTDALASSQFAR